MTPEKTMKNTQPLKKGESKTEDIKNLIQTVKSLREKIQTLQEEKEKLLREKSTLTKTLDPTLTHRTSSCDTATEKRDNN
jgi:regulator of replication initiation timing